MSSDPASERYEIRIDVAPDDIDVMDHVNNTVYLRWVQEAATGRPTRPGKEVLRRFSLPQTAHRN